MGVHNLWELLAPVGRRVSVETLAGKKLAIDASIWIVQFMKAMRDEKGEMVRNAHLIGFFRRICKLLFLRTKPVFVFDGGTPALKRRTVIARRRQRENAQTKIRKTAEKLLMNQLKTMKLKQLAEDIKTQRIENDAKGKKVLSDQTEVPRKYSEKNDEILERYNQEKLDEMLAASLAAEEDKSFKCKESTSAGIPLEDDDDDDDDEEMILPTISGKVDPAVLAALPPSMQLDLLVQMRERLMAENRQKYQKVKKTPSKFSELQIQSYLKTVAFRREIDEVRKSAAGRGVGGVQTSRIASESNREFIFSSSFTGDKQALTSDGAETCVNKEHQIQFAGPSGSSDNVASVVKIATATGSSVGDESGNALENDVETYMDDRGNLRVSRVRAMGFRMTRDLQRNLDMMKEMEQDRTIVNPGETSDGANDETDTNNNINEQFISKNGASIDISFEEDGEHKLSDGDDDIFARLVDGDPLVITSIDNTSLEKFSPNFDSESDWEEGFVEEKISISPMNDVKSVIMQSFVEGSTSYLSDATKNASTRHVEHVEAISIGCQEEETQLQEAMRRSLEDFNNKYVDASCKNVSRNFFGEMGHKSPKSKFQSDSFLQENEPVCLTDKHDDIIRTSTPVIPNDINETSEDMPSNIVNIQKETHKFIMSSEKLLKASNEIGEVSSISNSVEVNESCVSDPMFNNVPDAMLVDACKEGSGSGHETADLVVTVGEYSAKQTPVNFDVEQKMNEERNLKSFFTEKELNRDEAMEANLEEEMLVLGQEFINLGDEQRKNERNAESVSSEMFSECQELLQMFGLPYIIAPMEAEAQCAEMELANLVDGVVTDDSDVFLFGARSVYKNIFDERKYVETYFMKDIENELGLNRDKLIRMALLLGSDYTEGISGIGIVNAIEVVNAYPEEDGFRKFREWIESPDPNIFQAQKGSISRKPGSSVGENNENEHSMDQIDETKRIFMDKHRNVSKNWHIPSSFPSEAVISAYASPQVDKSTEPFSWGKPDLFVLRKLCWEKFGWNNQKADDLLLPVLKEYNKHETQLRLEAFYTFNERFAKVRSKRIEKAVKGITRNQSSELHENSMQPVSKARKKKRVRPIEPEANKSEKLLHETDNDDSKNKSNPKESSSHLQSGDRKRSKTGERRGSPIFSSAKSSSIDGNHSNNEEEVNVEKLEEPREVRRSTRSRKPVNYTMNGLENDDTDKASDQDGEDFADQHVMDQELSRLQGLGKDALVGPSDTNDQNYKGYSLDARMSVDHYDKQKLFCNEDELGELNVSHYGDPFLETEYSKDYLKMGGGFCMEEDETEKTMYERDNNSVHKTDRENHLIETDSNTKETSTVQNMDLELRNTTTVGVSNIVGPIMENAHDDSTSTTCVRALSGMPLLKRKRRKS